MKRPNPELIDDENPEITPEVFAQMRPARELFAEMGIPMPQPRKRGPAKRPAKVAVSMRLSPDVLAALRATGRGWQSRAEAALRDWLSSQARG
jgi:uncharacterized protein (DUF4415 family)